MIWLESMLAGVLVAAGDQVSKAVVLSRQPAASAAPAVAGPTARQ
jgi:hypothetical protein